MSIPIIALDAGHGMKTAGKRCLKSLDSKETREWYLNDRIVDKVQELLKEYECNVVRVDDTTGNKDVPLSTRVNQANKCNADIYISVHHNAGLGGKNGGGTVVFYCSNKQCRIEQSKKLYSAITNRTNLIGNRSKKVVNKGFYVLKKTKMPAFLIENGFMDSPIDVPIILSENHANKTAYGILDFLISELNLTNTKNTHNVKSEFFPKYEGEKTTLINALKDVGADNSYSYRKKIAKANGIVGYAGTYTQNVMIYNLLVSGILKRKSKHYRQ